MSKNLIQRIGVAAVAIPAILWICYQGGWWLSGMVLLFGTVAIVEYMWAEGLRPRHILFWLALLTVVATLLGTAAWDVYLASSPDRVASAFAAILLADAGLVFPFVFFVFSSLLVALGSRTPAELFERQARLFWGVVYVCFLYPFVVNTGSRSIESISGGDFLLLLFALLWVGDSAAMFGGKAFGKHKLAPTVSPNKTVEGFVCGILGAIVIGVIMYYWKLSTVGLMHVLIMSVGCSIFGQLGDLVESMWKRSRGIKDSSALIPGHGGVLDRFDSLLFAAPFMYAYLTFICG